MHPEYETDLKKKKINFGKHYFTDFFRRYGWRWGTIHGSRKYFPQEVITEEINRIQDRMKNYSAKNTWNADETAIFINDQGRSTFAPRDHVGRLVACEKQRVTGLLYIDAEGAIAFRPAIIDSGFSTGSNSGVIKEIKKEKITTVKGKKVLQVLKAREYKERFL